LLKFCHKKVEKTSVGAGIFWEGGKEREKASKTGGLLGFREYNPI
jgi:hypothetical protein